MYSLETGLRAGSRILLVEDDLLIALDLEEGLLELGCEVVGPYGRLDQAMAAVDRSLDGAIIDLNLRGQHSFPLIERLREHEVPTVVCSGYVELPEMRTRLAGIPVLSKPCTPAQLVAAVAGRVPVRREAPQEAAI